jgi:hypothetical protein
LGFFHTSKEGHPVQIQQLESLNYKWAQQYSVEDVEEFFYLLNERTLLVLLPTISHHFNKTIHTVVSILDLKNTGVFKIFTKVRIRVVDY